METFGELNWENEMGEIQLLSVAARHEHAMEKHDLIGYETWHVWPSNI